jgi:hypothetical protein
MALAVPQVKQYQPGFGVCVGTPLALCSGGFVLSFPHRHRWISVQAPRMACSRVML